MKNRRILSMLLAGVLTFSMAGTASASTEDEIAYMQEQKQAAETGLAQAQANIGSLESKKQELESYLAELNAQYDELTNSVAQLGIEAAQKEEELKQIKKDLKKARKAAKKQYEAMKIRIAYMYENGGSTMLELLLSSQSFAEFLNQAEAVSQISKYDREMLKKYEEVRKSVLEHEKRAEEEAASINSLLSERAARQQEVQSMAASTSDSIYAYIAEISASEAEAGALVAQINSADNSISALIQQAEAEKAAAEAEAAAASENESEYTDDAGYDPETDTTESSSSSTSSTIIVEEEEEDSYGDSGEYTSSGEENEGETYEEADTPESSEGESTGSGQGTYLGNFTLTAYCNCAQCCGTAGNATASGTMPTAGRTVAMAGVPFGTQLLINGNVYTVEDLGTPYGHVDIYFGSHEEALSFGLQYADVYQLN